MEIFSDTEINPLNPKLVKVIVKNTVRASKRTSHFTIRNINLLTLFKEMIAVYIEKSYRSHTYKMQS
jgi:hypothetical protein